MGFVYEKTDNNFYCEKWRKNMYAVKAIYDGTEFKPIQPITVKGEYEVIITFIEPIKKSSEKKTCILREPDTTKTPAIGEWDGMAVIPDVFNEPLDEMKEYMH